MSNNDVSHEPKPSPLAEKVEALREARDLTQEEVAEAVGMSLRSYSSFVNGHTQRLNTKNRKALRDFFGMDGAQAAGEELREGWPNDIRVFADFVGALLDTMGEEERIAFMEEETRRWLAIRLGQSS